MYIWNIEVETKWTYHNKDEDGDDENYCVSADSLETAIEKTKKVALAKSRNFYDDEDKRNHYPISLEFIRLERGDWIDA